MKVSFLQYDIVWGDTAANVRRVGELLFRAPAADLYVLPEMWSTGFTMQPELHAEAESGAALEWMKDFAAATGSAVAGSIAVRDGGKFFNRFHFVKPDGTVASYDKHHLFTYSGEDRHYEAGGRRVTVEWKGVRFRLAVCYDLRFPSWCRNCGDYDVLLCVASWPDRRSDAWKALLRARAIENQCYVLGVNRSGSDPSCHYTGDSAFIDAYGHTLAECPSGQEAFGSGEIDLDCLAGFRESFPVLRDADRIDYGQEIVIG